MNSLLLVDDDDLFRDVLGRALTRRGFAVTGAPDVAQALSAAALVKPAFAVVDLKLPDDSGLLLLAGLRRIAPDVRILMLTGYASIATAVEAIKRGAHHYLAKPVDADEVVAVLRGDGAPPPDGGGAEPDRPLSVERLEWEHIQKVLLEHDGNISSTARSLNMHRRTLQRKLGKRPRRD